jgi:hypothetical protein|tara:strand:+ start:163 stop:588 length:426 start_codon:yes stop_codon:yes gene_type:complete
MKNVNKFMLMAIFGLAVNVFANNAIYSKAQSFLESDAPEISVVYDSSLVATICPKGSAGCFSSANGGSIYLSTDIPAHHHDVVLFGLFTDYIQYEDYRVIDSNYTCESKVKFLQNEGESHLANLYQGQCNTLYKGKILVSL